MTKQWFYFYYSKKELFERIKLSFGFNYFDWNDIRIIAPQLHPKIFDALVRKKLVAKIGFNTYQLIRESYI